jgi:type II secretion system protein I
LTGALRHRRGRRLGFTLLEVLVASTIMAVAVTTLLSALSTTMRNAAQLTESDKAAIVGKRVLDSLLAEPALTQGEPMTGRLDPAQTGLEGGWTAQVTVFDSAPGVRAIVQRVAVEVWWMRGPSRRVLLLEGFRRTPSPGGV